MLVLTTKKASQRKLTIKLREYYYHDRTFLSSVCPVYIIQKKRKNNNNNNNNNNKGLSVAITSKIKYSGVIIR